VLTINLSTVDNEAGISLNPPENNPLIPLTQYNYISIKEKVLIIRMLKNEFIIDHFAKI